MVMMLRSRFRYLSCGKEWDLGTSKLPVEKGFVYEGGGP
jgi:hypothetical protein